MKCLPVERVVKIWEYCKECLWIVALMIVPDNIQHCKHNMECVKYVKSCEQIVKTDLFLVKQNNNRQNVT